MIRRLFRWTLYLFIALVVLFVAAILLLDTAARTLIEDRIRKQTGLDVKVGHCRVGLNRSTVTLENLTLNNTAEFGGGPFLEIPELHLEIHRTDLGAGKLHFRLVRLNVAQIHVVQRKDGLTNLRAFQQRRPALATDSAGVSLQPSGTSPRNLNANFPGFDHIDMFNLTLGSADYVSLQDPSRNREALLNIRNQIYQNVFAKDLESIFVALSLKKRAEFLVEGFLPSAAARDSSLDGRPKRQLLENAALPVKKEPLKK